MCHTVQTRGAWRGEAEMVAAVMVAARWQRRLAAARRRGGYSDGGKTSAGGRRWAAAAGGAELRLATVRSAGFAAAPYKAAAASIRPFRAHANRRCQHVCCDPLRSSRCAHLDVVAAREDLPRSVSESRRGDQQTLIRGCRLSQPQRTDTTSTWTWTWDVTGSSGWQRDLCDGVTAAVVLVHASGHELEKQHSHHQAAN